jgi:hypothetical protein
MTLASAGTSMKFIGSPRREESGGCNGGNKSRCAAPRKVFAVGAGCEKVGTGSSRRSRSKPKESIRFMTLDRLDPKSS